MSAFKEGKLEKTELLFSNRACSLPADQIGRIADDWLLECDFRHVSKTTISKYRTVVDHLVWFLSDLNLSQCGKRELQQFLIYLRNGHEDLRGRWGNCHLRKPASSGTAMTYFTVLRTFFSFMVSEGELPKSPLDTVSRPVDRPDQITPFTLDQVRALRTAATRSRHPKRDEAIVLMLFDTGLRASELCGIQMSNVDLHERRCSILGKGNKKRSVFFCRETARAVHQYTKESEQSRVDNGLLFLADRGERSGEGLTRSGLFQLIERLGKVAKIDGIRCSPHVFRHTFAIEFLRSGGNVFTLKELLGHTSLSISNRYVSLAQADIERQHRLYSPVEQLRGLRPRG